MAQHAAYEAHNGGLTHDAIAKAALSALTRAYRMGVEDAAKVVNAARPCPIDYIEQAIEDDALKDAEAAIRALLPEEKP